MYPPAKAELKARGVPFTEREATQLKASDLEKYDLFIGMDSANIRNIHRILGKGCEGKVYKLLSFAGSDRDVSDPWYSDRFDIAYEDIYRGAVALLDLINKGLFPKNI
jgi:protein-tyrosine phosphatase